MSFSDSSMLSAELWLEANIPKSEREAFSCLIITEGWIPNAGSDTTAVLALLLLGHFRRQPSPLDSAEMVLPRALPTLDLGDRDKEDIEEFILDALEYPE